MNTLRSLCSESRGSKTIDPSGEGGDQGHHVRDQFLLWSEVLLLQQDDQFHTMVLENAFNKVHPETSKPVPVGDEESVNDTPLCEVEESSDPPTSHVQSRTDVCEDQGTGLEESPAVSGECPELPVQVTIGLLAVP